MFDGDIITNPPYKYATEFVRKGLERVEEGHKVAMFLKVLFLEGKSRRELFKQYPPCRIYVCSGRIDCAKNGDFKALKENGGGALAYAWFIWRKGYKGKQRLKHTDMLIPDDNNKPQKVSFMHANQMLLEGLAAWGRYCEKLDGLFNNNNNMETKEMKIVPPEGYEIDKENSTFEIVRFKPVKKEITYNDIESELSQAPDNVVAFINDVSEKHAKKIFAISKLMNVAKYLNGEDWKPDCRTQSYYIAIADGNIKVFISYPTGMDIHFKSGKLAQQAIDILGEETIRLALSTDW